MVTRAYVARPSSCAPARSFMTDAALLRTRVPAQLADLEIVMFVFIGNFASDFIGPTTENNADAYRANFEKLADLILRFPSLASRSQFVFVPGPADPMETNVLPKVPESRRPADSLNS